MKSYIVCNITHIVYKIEDFDCYAYTPMGGNLCKYAYHLLYINATFIRFIQSIATHIHKYSKKYTIFHAIFVRFCTKISKKLYKTSHFYTKIVQKITKKYTFYHIFYSNATLIHNLSTNNCG